MGGIGRSAELVALTTTFPQQVMAKQYINKLSAESIDMSTSLEIGERNQAHEMKNHAALILLPPEMSKWQRGFKHSQTGTQVTLPLCWAWCKYARMHI